MHHVGLLGSHTLSTSNIACLICTVRPPIREGALLQYLHYYPISLNASASDLVRRLANICTIVSKRKHAYAYMHTHLRNNTRMLKPSHAQVLDARSANTPKEMFDAICHHMKYANNGGNLRYATCHEYSLMVHTRSDRHSINAIRDQVVYSTCIIWHFNTQTCVLAETHRMSMCINLDTHCCTWQMGPVVVQTCLLGSVFISGSSLSTAVRIVVCQLWWLWQVVTLGLDKALWQHRVCSTWHVQCVHAHCTSVYCIWKWSFTGTCLSWFPLRDTVMWFALLMP